MSVVLVSAVDPYPVDAGKKVVLRGFIDYFSERLGPDNVHYLLVGADPSKPFPVQLHSLPKPTTNEALRSLLSRTGTGRASIQESLLRSANTQRAVRDLLGRIGADLEVYDTVRMGQYAPADTGGRQICYLDDLFSERYQAMLEASARYPDVDVQPLGNFVEHVPSRARFLADDHRVQRALLHVEKQLIRRSEDRAVSRFRRSLLVNEVEVETLRKRAGGSADSVQDIPPLITTPRDAPRQFTGSPEYVFLGLLSLPHNDDGLRNFLDCVWPIVLSKRPDARLRVVGSNALPQLTQSVARYPDSVELVGFVPDLTELFGRSAALINPLRFGSGIKLKVMEALGRGTPVVSTGVGASGISTGAEYGVLVADEPEELAERLIEAADGVVNAKLSRAATLHFEQRYSRKAVFERYDSAFGIA